LTNDERPRTNAGATETGVLSSLVFGLWSVEEQIHLALNRLDGLIGGALAAKRPKDTLLMTSDHGNVESIAAPAHTRNPVPLLVVGPAARAFEGVESIMEIADIVDKVTG
jgi:2,3-bisphosphoglycerate-independent phosphoglycerate mutase